MGGCRVFHWLRETAAAVNHECRPWLVDSHSCLVHGPSHPLLDRKVATSASSRLAEVVGAGRGSAYRPHLYQLPLSSETRGQVLALQHPRHVLVGAPREHARDGPGVAGAVLDERVAVHPNAVGQISVSPPEA